MERDFKGVWIPKEIWLDSRLNALEKVILAEIDSLDKGDEGCWASNQYIAEFCQCSATKVSTAITKLIDLEYLYLQNFDGRTRILKSRLSNFERQNFKNCNADIKNLKDTNTSNKQTTNTNKKERKKETYDSIISEYVTDSDVVQAIYDFIKMRQMIKKPLTDRALHMVLKRLLGFSSDPQEQIQILENAINGCWQNIYAISEKKTTKKVDEDYLNSLD